ncbi:MAG: hypothetical protein J6Y13_03080, partial [Treponema sp.]|nr:hypothetical protein [Treponema sp.]
MQVIRASVMGFCMGVKRAVEKAEQALDEAALAAGQTGGVCPAGGTGGPALREAGKPAVTEATAAAGGGCPAGGTGGPALYEAGKPAVTEATAAAGGGCPAARVFSLGPLIHNPTVLSDFEERGLTILSPDSSCFP